MASPAISYNETDHSCEVVVPDSMDGSGVDHLHMYSDEREVIGYCYSNIPILFYHKY